MKKAARILSILCCMAIMISGIVHAAELGIVMNVYTDMDSIILFVKDQQREITNVYLGSDEAQNFAVENAGSTRTIVVLDNSLSINKKYRETIKTFLTDLVASRKDGDTFTIATFAENITYLAEESNDYLDIKTQIEQLEFTDQDSYFVNTLYTVMNDIGNYQENKYTRVIVIADGVDNEALGYTDEELNRKIQTTQVPVYTIGCRGEDESLKKMFALSRSSNAKSYLLDDMSESDILQDLAEDSNVVKIRIVPQDKSCDGTKRAVRISFGEDYCTVEASMPFKTAPAEETERLPQTLEAPAETQTLETQPPLTKPSEEVPFTTGETITEEIEPMGANMILFVLIGIAVVVAAAVIILIVCMKKSKPIKEKSGIDLSGIGHSSNINGAGENKTEILNENPENGESDKTAILGANDSLQLSLQDMDDPTRTFSYPVRDKLLIGRDTAKCQIVINYNKYISAIHCEIIMKGNRLYVRDGGGEVIASTNGTFVNGQKAAPELPLPSGAVLKLGQIRFKVTY